MSFSLPSANALSTAIGMSSMPHLGPVSGMATFTNPGSTVPDIPGIGGLQGFPTARHPQGPTNGVSNWHLILRLPETNPHHDIGRGELTFTQWSAKQHTMWDHSYQARSLSRLNYHLTTEECRKRFGTQTSCEELMNTWRLYGIQQHDYDGTDVYAYHTMGVVPRVYNIWNACGKDVHHGTKLWLIVRRDKFVSPLESALSHVDQEDEEYRSKRYKKAGVIGFQKTSDIHSSPGNIGIPLKESDKFDEDGNPGEFVWQFYPWVSETNDPPPIDLYQQPTWRGDFLEVGKVVQLHGNHYKAGEAQRVPMQKAVFPTSCDDSYRSYLYLGNEVEIAFRKGC